MGWVPGWSQPQGEWVRSAITLSQRLVALPDRGRVSAAAEVHDPPAYAGPAWHLAAQIQRHLQRGRATLPRACVFGLRGVRRGVRCPRCDRAGRARPGSYGRAMPRRWRWGRQGQSGPGPLAWEVSGAAGPCSRSVLCWWRCERWRSWRRSSCRVLVNRAARRGRRATGRRARSQTGASSSRLRLRLAKTSSGCVTMALRSRKGPASSRSWRADASGVGVGGRSGGT